MGSAWGRETAGHRGACEGVTTMTEQDDGQPSKPAPRPAAADAGDLSDAADVDRLYEQALRRIAALNAEWARAVHDVGRAGPTA